MTRYPGIADIKQFYEWKCYTDEKIQEYVEIEWITKEQYKEITGKDYPSPSDISSGEADENAGVELNKEG
ncbi:XkdX family protein [Bacillus vallismortis]|uniref:XkdX family protein n=1 Tax=Bacillus vallismortis TaxID=72361 RepID=UPI002090A937|nr:XkdX family protein [Bacillus vallismortis]MCO4849702.1 XkdX family protein [Bacillus vallismortis]